MSNPHPQQFSEDYVRKVARLSRLALTDAEVEDCRTKLSAVVGYMERLKQLDLENVEPMVNVGEVSNRFDDDAPGPTIPNAVFTKMAPYTVGPFVRVPKVLDDEGGA